MPLYTDQFKRNNDVFRNTMEAIFQKYSNLSDAGIDICLKTMTCRTGRGPVPIDSAEGERELEALKTRVKADYSVREFEDQENDKMDMSGVTEDDLNGSGQQEDSENLWHEAESFQQSVNLNTTSPGSLWSELSLPKEEDEELEKSLSSNGSTLLDVYPRMLTQIGEAYRRQHLTDTARSVVQKYRRNHWQTGPTQRNTSFKNRHGCTLNKTTDISFSNQIQSPAQRNIGNCFKGSPKLQNLLKNKLKSSPLDVSYESSACFYSPRRNSVDVSGVTDQSAWIDVALTRKPEQNPARVIDFSTPSYSGSPSHSDKSPDLDQTYDVEPTSPAVPTSSILTSPQQSRAGLSITDQRETSIISQLSSLDKDCFRDRLHPPVPSPHRSFIGVLSPNGKSTFRPSILNIERQINSIGSPKRRSSVIHQELLRSPYGAKQVPFSSQRRPVYDNTDQTSSKVESRSHFTPLKRQRSFSGSPSSYSFSGSQIDAEFRKLYHHFICRGTSSPCASSHCHLCERHTKESFQSPGFSSSSMSALALTPLRAKLKKRSRQPEVEESLRFKRFRESRSPLKHFQLTDLHEDKHAWDRGVLLQCPSPGFLRGTGNLRRIREAKLKMQMNQHALSWRDAPSGVHLLEAASPMRHFNQATASHSPSLSRRRLQYSLLQ
nr:Si:dkeyp-117h8.4 protein [Danio rerio]